MRSRLPCRMSWTYIGSIQFRVAKGRITNRASLGYSCVFPMNATILMVNVSMRPPGITVSLIDSVGAESVHRNKNVSSVPSAAFDKAALVRCQACRPFGFIPCARCSVLLKCSSSTSAEKKFDTLNLKTSLQPQTGPRPCPGVKCY